MGTLTRTGAVVLAVVMIMGAVVVPASASTSAVTADSSVDDADITLSNGELFGSFDIINTGTADVTVDVLVDGSSLITKNVTAGTTDTVLLPPTSIDDTISHTVSVMIDAEQAFTYQTDPALVPSVPSEVLNVTLEDNYTQYDFVADSVADRVETKLVGENDYLSDDLTSLSGNPIVDGVDLVLSDGDSAEYADTNQSVLTDQSMVTAMNFDSTADLGATVEYETTGSLTTNVVDNTTSSDDGEDSTTINIPQIPGGQTETLLVIVVAGGVALALLRD